MKPLPLISLLLAVPPQSLILSPAFARFWPLRPVTSSNVTNRCLEWTGLAQHWPRAQTGCVRPGSREAAAGPTFRASVREKPGQSQPPPRATKYTASAQSMIPDRARRVRSWGRSNWTGEQRRDFLCRAVTGASVPSRHAASATPAFRHQVWKGRSPSTPTPAVQSRRGRYEWPSGGVLSLQADSNSFWRELHQSRFRADVLAPFSFICLHIGSGEHVNSAAWGVGESSSSATGSPGCHPVFSSRVPRGFDKVGLKEFGARLSRLSVQAPGSALGSSICSQRSRELGSLMGP